MLTITGLIRYTTKTELTRQKLVRAEEFTTEAEKSAKYQTLRKKRLDAGKCTMCGCRPRAVRPGRLGVPERLLTKCDPCIKRS